MTDQPEKFWQGPIRSPRHAQRILNFVAALFVLPGVLFILAVGAAYAHDPATSGLKPLFIGIVMVALPGVLSKYASVRVANMFIAYSVLLALTSVALGIVLVLYGVGLFAFVALPFVLISLCCLFASQRAARAARYLHGYRNALVVAGASTADLLSNGD